MIATPTPRLHYVISLSIAARFRHLAARLTLVGHFRRSQPPFAWPLRYVAAGCCHAGARLPLIFADYFAAAWLPLVSCRAITWPLRHDCAISPPLLAGAMGHAFHSAGATPLAIRLAATCMACLGAASCRHCCRCRRRRRRHHYMPLISHYHLRHAATLSLHTSFHHYAAPPTLRHHTLPLIIINNTIIIINTPHINMPSSLIRHHHH